MNRWLMVMGLTVVGCAASVEDPQPAPPPEPTQKEPPAQTFSGDLVEDPDTGVATGLGDGVPSLPPRQKPPVPGMRPVPEQE